MALEWLDPEEATTAGIVTLGLILTVVTLVVSYVVAWYWHKYRDQKTSE